MTKTFTASYFEKWYHSPRHRVRTAAALNRRVALAVAVAEYLLERPIRRVLDVGCGEGEWGVVLRRLRPKASYVGLDPSAYAVRRFGARRHLRNGSFGELERVPELESFDLVVCVDVLHYVERDEIVRGARALADRLRGVAMLHAFTRRDDIDGDVRDLKRRTARWYRDTFGRAGLTPVGLACWVGFPLASRIAALDGC